MSTDKRKKRDLVPDYQDLILFLVDNGKDIHELEVSDSERAAVRAKGSLREFRKKVETLYDRLEEVRVEIVSKRA